MSRDLSAGPAAGAPWLPYPAPGAPGAPILAVPDGANPERAAAGMPELYHGLPAAPQVARDAAGQPVLSLSLLLERPPRLDEDDIFALIDSAVLACDLSLALPHGAASGGLQPLFSRKAHLRLTAGRHAPVLAAADGWGAGARIALGARLDRSQAQAVLRALHGLTCGLALDCELAYRSAGARRDVSLAFHWAAIHDLVARHLDADGSLSGTALRALLPAMLEAGALVAWLTEPGRVHTPLPPSQAGILWKPFLMFCAMVLARPAQTQPEAPIAPQGGAPSPQGERFVLLPRPDDDARLDTRVTLDSSAEESTMLQAPLEEVFGTVLDGLDLDRFIHLTCIDPGSPDGVGPVPRRVRSTPASRAAAKPAQGDAGLAWPGLARPGLALVGADAVSLTRAIEPDSRSRAPAGALLASDAIKLHAGPAHAFSTHALAFERIEETGEPVLPLPRVDDPNAPLWPDQSDAKHFWYAPEFTVIAPDADNAPESSSFLFNFRESGHDASGRLTLEGSVRLSLRRGASAATLAALDARAAAGSAPRADPVPLTSLAASLSLPMRDSSGKLRRVDLPAELLDKGATVTLDIALLNDYVRVAYGDLAYAGFQVEPARLQIAYSFDAMVPVPQLPLSVENAGKLHLTPVAYSVLQQKQLAGRPHLDAMHMTYRGVAADLQFRRETSADTTMAMAEVGAAQGAESGPAARRGASLAASATLAGRPLGSLQLAKIESNQLELAPAIRPKLEHSERLQDLIRRRRYARQAQGRSSTLDLLFPCGSHVALYRQERDGLSVGIGCQDSFSLGQAPLKLYQAVTDPALASPKYKLYSSMTQPGRYLVLPAVYLITRFSPAEGERAWRPTIHLYSTLDTVSAANNRCVLMATLQPDLSPRERHALATRLARPFQSTTIDYVTALDTEVQYTWALPTGAAAVEVDAARMWDSFQVTLATDRTGALLLQSMLTHTGVIGQVQFKLADGTTLASTLRLDLNHLTGPWDSGPLAITLAAASATLVNRIERALDVGDLLVAGADGAEVLVACERTLAPGQSLTLDLPAGLALPASGAWAACTIPAGDPATLTAINSFVENIDTNVLFCNLIDFTRHALVKLSIMARIKQAPGSDVLVTWRTEDVGEARFVLPLTVYQGPRTLQFQLTKTDTAGAVTTTPWLESDLAANGVVSLIWDLIN